MTAEDLKKLLDVRKPQLQLVIISACNSRQTAQVMDLFSLRHSVGVKMSKYSHANTGMYYCIRFDEFQPCF